MIDQHRLKTALSSTDLKKIDSENEFMSFCFSNGYKNGFENSISYGIRDEYIIENQNDLINLDAFINKHPTLSSFISYNLKDLFYPLESSNPSPFNIPLGLFIAPKTQHYLKQLDINVDQIILPGLSFSSETSKEKYINTVKTIQERIKNGDVYEVNYCIEFKAELKQSIEPLDIYFKLNSISPMPFSCFFKWKEFTIISASPERFLKNEGDLLQSSPIKGTAKRNLTNSQLDQAIKKALLNSEKERAENLMIVDLVRNDLNRICNIGSVVVDELFKIDSFPQVHQMISTISGTKKEGVEFTDILKSTFPMGSMTGAPKLMAMKLIEHYEQSSRSAFSGSIGRHIDNSFDYNVLIRSIFYNTKTNQISFQVGSAITLDSDPEAEYEECLLKAKAIIETFQ